MKEEHLIPSDDEFDRFALPWKYPNTLGVLEVDEDDIELGDFIGSGKKASTRKATWNGKTIALKCLDPDNHRSNPYSHWEMSRYCDLQAVQGTLIPKLYFVSRDKEAGTRMFGLELGEGASSCDKNLKEQMDITNEKLIEQGWMQRECSWRADNVVWMKNSDGSRRIVGIDLESFMPSFSPKAPPPTLTPKTIYGLPIIHPTELEMYHENPEWSWINLDGQTCPGLWKEDKKVAVFSFDTPSKFRKSMTRLMEWPADQADIVARPLFVTLERSGAIVVGYEPFQESTYRPQTSQSSQDINATLAKANWKIQDSFSLSFSRICTGLFDGEHHRRVIDLSCLEAIVTEPEELALANTSISDDESAETTTPVDPSCDGD